MTVSAGPPVEPLHDQQEKGSLASGAVAHRSTPGTIARVGRIDTRAQAEVPSARRSATPRSMAAVLKMKKLDSAALQKAYAG